MDRKHFAAGAGQQWDERSLDRREALVGELAELCQSNPLVAVESHAQFAAMLERTREIEKRIGIERSAIAQALQETETSLRQLGAFGDQATADATLVDRLA